MARISVQDVLQFAAHHWLLCGLFVVLLILLMIEEARSKGLMGQLTPQDLVQMINRESVAIVDIRNREAFQSGHIVGAINIPKADLEKDFGKLNKYKNRSIIIVCEGGQKAGEIAMKLKKQNFENVRALSGGLNGWRSANMPLIKK
jgi:rhodanese-related sulfurtransferase